MCKKLFGEPLWFWLLQGGICGVIVEVFILCGTGHGVVAHCLEVWK